MVDTLLTGLRDDWSGANLNSDRGIGGKESGEENSIFDDGVGCDGSLAVGVSSHTTGLAGGGWGGAIPVLELIAGDGEGGSFVLGDVVREEVAEGVVGQAGYVLS